MNILKKKFGNDSTWAGISSDGQLLTVRHCDLLNHMKSHYDKYAVESSTAYIFNGVRLVRGRYPIRAAINARWYDLGKKLSEYYKETDNDE